MPNRPRPRSRRAHQPSSTSKPRPSSVTEATTSSGSRTSSTCDVARHWRGWRRWSAPPGPRGTAPARSAARARVAVLEAFGAERHVRCGMRDAYASVWLSGRQQPQIVERRRRSSSGQHAHGFEGLRSELAELVDLTAHVLGRSRDFLQDSSRVSSDGQRLGRLVVQLASDALALVFLGARTCSDIFCSSWRCSSSIVEASC